MDESEENKVLMHSTSSISIPVNSLDSDHNNEHSIEKSRTFALLYQCIPQDLHPHAKNVQKWNRFFLSSCLFTGFLDSLYLFLLYTKQDNNCVVVNRTMIKVVIFLRSQTNIIYLLQMLLKFRLAYVDPESRVLVEHPKRIAINYLSGYFLIDLFIVLPLSQVVMCLVLQMSNWSYGAIDAVNVLQVAIVFQYMAMFCRALPLFADQSTSAFFFESWLAKFVINLLAFFLFSHAVGSFWYFFALHSVKHCLIDACGEFWCLKYIYCGQGNEDEKFKDDPTSINATATTTCFYPSDIKYGIYADAVNLTTNPNLLMRYTYSLFWGFQQISTMAGNQTPAFFFGEVVFTMFITATGLVLFSLLIGNMQNFLQALGRKKLKMSVRRLDVEQWMSQQRLPEELRRKIRESERYNWVATRGVNELILLENLSEDLQRDVRRHIFRFIRNIPIFTLMDESILDAIMERLKRKTYITGSRILDHGGLINKMVFIVHGKVESIGEDQNVVLFPEGDVCGEELITLCLDQQSAPKRGGKRIRIPAHKLLSNKMVRCLTNVEAYTLSAADLEEVMGLYSRLLLKNSHVQAAIRKEFLYREGFARSKSF